MLEITANHLRDLDVVVYGPQSQQSAALVPAPVGARDDRADPVWERALLGRAERSSRWLWLALGKRGVTALAVEYGAGSEATAVPNLPKQVRLGSQVLAGHRSTHRAVYRNAAPLKLSIVMAAFNEAETITQAVEEVLDVDFPCEVELIVVDDGSSDATPLLLARFDDPRLVVLRHPTNQGKGAAVLSAVAAATGTHILPFDADLEYLPDDILRIIEPVLRGRCNVVYGVRLFGCNTVYRSYLYAVGNKMFTATANILFGSYLSDLHTCLKLIPIDVMQSLHLRESGFGLDTEVSASLLRCGIRPFEVPVSYYSRSHDEGKKITWRDAFACLWILLRVRAQSRSRFGHADELARTPRRPRLSEAKSAEERQPPSLLVNDAVGEIPVGTTG